MKYKLLLVLAILFIYASSCDDDTEIEVFDHAGQSIIDNDTLVKYMQEHFVDMDGVIQEIENNEQAIFDSANLHTKEVVYTIGGEEVDYTLYYYIVSLGAGEKPARVDRANVAYKGMDLDGSVFDQNAYGSWFDLYSSVIAGWSYGMINFNSGIRSLEPLPDGSYEYSDTGKGILFIPSGLAYANSGSGDIGVNEPLIFYVEMNEVFHVDHDSDNVLSMDEDLNNNGIYIDDDTDDDGSPNFVDTDDDGDGTPTIEEDANNDSDPTNDGIDDNDDLPDYLDPDVS